MLCKYIKYKKSFFAFNFIWAFVINFYQHTMGTVTNINLEKGNFSLYLFLSLCLFPTIGEIQAHIFAYKFT